MIPSSAGRHLASILDRFILFQASDEFGRRELSQHAYSRRYSAGDPIFHTGDPGDRMMAVVSGTVRITVPNKSGREVVLSDVVPGEVFGEIALLDGRERSATAVAYTSCDLLVLERRDVIPFLLHHPEVCMTLLSFLCARVRRSDQRMFDFAFCEMRIRLARLLLANGTGSDGAKVRLNQSEMADMIVARREKVSHQLSQWRTQGILDRERGWIIILRPDALARISNEQD